MKAQLHKSPSQDLPARHASGGSKLMDHPVEGFYREVEVVEDAEVLPRLFGRVEADLAREVVRVPDLGLQVVTKTFRFDCDVDEGFDAVHLTPIFFLPQAVSNLSRVIQSSLPLK